MSRLRIFSEANPDAPLLATESHEQIAAQLAKIGVRFEQWQAAADVAAGRQPGRRDGRLSPRYRPADRGEGLSQSVDVVSIAPDNPDREAMRSKFLDEHFHKEDEVRFFVAGSGLFTLHVGDQGL